MKVDERKPLFRVTNSSALTFLMLLCLFSTIINYQSSTKTLSHFISTELVVRHLVNLEKIAYSKPWFFGSRSTTRGHNASVSYVVDFLKNHTDYTVWTEPVVVQDQTDFKPPTLTISISSSNSSYSVPEHDILTLSGSGTSDLTDSKLAHISDCSEGQLTELGGVGNRAALIPLNPPSIDTKCPGICDRIIAVVEAGATGVIVYPRPFTSGYPRPLPPSGRIRCSNDQFRRFREIPAVMLGQKSGYEVLRYSR
jgi:hypothetical protein